MHQADVTHLTQQTPPAPVRRVNITHDMITLYFRDDDALEQALAKLPHSLAHHPRTLVNRTGACPQLWIPILATVH